MAQGVMTSDSFAARVKQSFYDSIGDIVFGMEDGTVSIFGLVFGLAASVNSSAEVLLKYCSPGQRVPLQPPSQ